MFSLSLGKRSYSFSFSFLSKPQSTPLSYLNNVKNIVNPPNFNMVEYKFKYNLFKL